MEQRGDAQVIAANVPLSRDVRVRDRRCGRMTQGRANYSMEFAHYEEVPPNNAEKIVATGRSWRLGRRQTEASDRRVTLPQDRLDRSKELE